MYIERAIQIIRIINAKLHDIYKIEQSGHPVTEMSFEWTTLLRCVESFDMNRKFYRNIPDCEQVLEFLMLNPHCPRSISYSLNGIAGMKKKSAGMKTTIQIPSVLKLENFTNSTDTFHLTNIKMIFTDC